jgi:excinuclease ABC subunit B
VDAIQRVIILSELRKGEFDCLIGINLLREGIDLPEVALVAILDADKEGFLRSERSLIQVSGRAARNANGRVILYADRETDSIKKLLKISKERRLKQDAYNKKYNIIPETIRKSIRETIGSSIAGVSSAIASTASNVDYCVSEGKSAYGEKPDDFEMLVQELENEMLEAASALEYERAAMLRDKIKQLTKEMKL